MPQRPRKNQIANVLWARYVLCCVISLEKIKRVFVLFLVVFAISACTQRLNEMRVDVKKVRWKILGLKIVTNFMNVRECYTTQLVTRNSSN